nr:Bifunctional IPC transferase and DIPP synthase [Candidatus Anoxychlamydiales bacterium]
MKAIILAAGRGSRLKKETKDKPKCLTVLANKTLLKWQIEALNKADIQDIVVVRGYLKNCINFKDLSFIDNDRWNETNMVFSLSLADSILKTNTCIISYSDIIYHPSIVSKLIKTKGDIVISYDLHW